MIRREVFQELRLLDNMIQNATANYDGESYTYHDVCARWENECFYNDILNLDYIMDEVSSIELHLLAMLMIMTIRCCMFLVF